MTCGPRADMLGSYTGGFNENDAKMTPFCRASSVPRSGGGAKTMTWPVSWPTTSRPGAASSRRARARADGRVPFSPGRDRGRCAVLGARIEQKLAATASGRPRPRDQLCGGAIRRDLQRQTAQRGLDAVAGPPWIPPS